MAPRVVGFVLIGLLTAACAAPARAGRTSSATSLPSPSTVTTETTTMPTTTTTQPPPPPCAAPVEACVSLTTRQAWLLSAGAVVYGPVPISYGAPGSPTPTGTFSVSWKDKENTSSLYRIPMPYSVFFAPGGIAFHEGDVAEDSHGCVHLPPGAAPVFFDSLVPGDVVRIVP